MEGDEIVAAHTRAPRAVDVGDDAVRELEGSVGSVIHIDLVGLAILVPALRDVGRAEAGDAFDFAEQIVEHVAPVAEHIEDDAAAVLLAIIPRRPLRRLPVAFEHPVAEFAAYREDAAEETGIDEHLELEEAGKEELVLHNAVLDAGRFRRARHPE